MNRVVFTGTEKLSVCVLICSNMLKFYINDCIHLLEDTTLKQDVPVLWETELRLYVIGGYYTV